MEQALSIIEPPKKIKEKIGWETMTGKEKNIMRLFISGMELIALADLALFAETKYITKQNEIQKDAANQLITDIQQKQGKPAIFPGVARLHEALESSKTLKSYQVSNSEELTKAITDINLQNSEIKDSTKYEIQINGEIRIEDQLDIKAQGKQESETNKYFDTNCGLLLPEGVSLKIIGSDPAKDKLILSTQKIGIYGQNLGEITFSNLTIERRGPLGGQVDQPINDKELLRSLIYLTTKNESIVTSRANINNVVLLNSVPQKREGEYNYLLYSGMTFA